MTEKQYALVEQKAYAQVDEESCELSLHRELQILRWQLRTAIREQDHRRIVALTEAIKSVAIAQSKLGLLGAHTILTTAAQEHFKASTEQIPAIVRDVLIAELIGHVDSDDLVSFVEAIAQKVFKRIIDLENETFDRKKLAKINRQAMK